MTAPHLARGACLALGLALPAGCARPGPCATARARIEAHASRPYAGRWRVTRADTLTFPQMGDRFRLTEVALDTARIVTGGACRFRGRLVFSIPRAETLAVTWTPGVGQALVFGWPADLGPFGGIGASLLRDSLHGTLLFDSRVGIHVPPGVTAQFMAARMPRE
jgi:hypothetical protein